jgi:hypothetical protein
MEASKDDVDKVDQPQEVAKVEEPPEVKNFAPPHEDPKTTEEIIANKISKRQFVFDYVKRELTSLEVFRDQVVSTIEKLHLSKEEVAIHIEHLIAFGVSDKMIGKDGDGKEGKLYKDIAKMQKQVDVLETLMTDLGNQRTEDIKMVTQYVTDLSHVPGQAPLNELIDQISKNEQDIKKSQS